MSRYAAVTALMTRVTFVCWLSGLFYVLNMCTSIWIDNLHGMVQGEVLEPLSFRNTSNIRVRKNCVCDNCENCNGTAAMYCVHKTFFDLTTGNDETLTVATTLFQLALLFSL